MGFDMIRNVACLQTGNVLSCCVASSVSIYGTMYAKIVTQFELFGASICSFIADSQFHKAMFLIEYELSLKYLLKNLTKDAKQILLPMFKLCKQSLFKTQPQVAMYETTEQIMSWVGKSRIAIKHRIESKPLSSLKYTPYFNRKGCILRLC